MREIPLTRGKVALVDDADFKWLARFKWQSYQARPGEPIYARRTDHSNESTVFMHRLILGTPEGMKSDHKNGNGLDNRRENLRLATNHQNGQNQRLQHRIKRSRFKGVHCVSNSWVARIGLNRERCYLGCFGSEEDAARAYDAAAIFHFGEYARTNFSDVQPAESLVSRRPTRRRGNRKVA